MNSPFPPHNTAPGNPSSPTGSKPTLNTTSPLNFSTQPPPVPPQRGSTNMIAKKIECLPKELMVFLEHDFDVKWEKPTKLLYFQFIYLFNNGTTAKPTHKKEKLKEAFDKEVKPIIQPFIKPPPADNPNAIEISSPSGDFDPLSRKTTRDQLKKTIKQIARNVDIAPAARTDQILCLYKAYVDEGLVLPENKRFTQRPRAVPLERVQKETVEELRHTLQAYAPHIFIHSVALTHSTLVDLYMVFIHDAPAPSGQKIVLGYHYSIIPRK